MLKKFVLMAEVWLRWVAGLNLWEVYNLSKMRQFFLHLPILEAQQTTTTERNSVFLDKGLQLIWIAQTDLREINVGCIKI